MRAIALGLRVSCVAACALTAHVSRAAQPLTSAQALAFIRIGGLRFSPDGRQLAGVVVSYRWNALAQIRVVDTASGTSRGLTPAGKAERSPEWSPDGRTLAFLSNRGGRTQVYAVPDSRPTAATGAAAAA
jgi:dipeptidyl aminopeptidase/acylaminoacyl peptidase